MLFIVIIAGVAYGWWYVGRMGQYCELMFRAGDKAKMFDLEIKDRLLERANWGGYYDPSDEFYCIWTGDRTHWDLSEAHEQIHAMIDQNLTCNSGNESCYEHFCIKD